jgi:hypothetical protein
MLEDKENPTFSRAENISTKEDIALNSDEQSTNYDNSSVDNYPTNNDASINNSLLNANAKNDPRTNLLIIGVAVLIFSLLSMVFVILGNNI